MWVNDRFSIHAILLWDRPPKHKSHAAIKSGQRWESSRGHELNRHIIAVSQLNGKFPGSREDMYSINIFIIFNEEH